MKIKELGVEWASVLNKTLGSYQKEITLSAKKLFQKISELFEFLDRLTLFHFFIWEHRYFLTAGKISTAKCLGLNYDIIDTYFYF